MNFVWIEEKELPFRLAEIIAQGLDVTPMTVTELATSSDDNFDWYFHNAAFLGQKHGLVYSGTKVLCEIAQRQ